MTAAKQRLLQMVPRMPRLIPGLTDDLAQQMLNMLDTVEPEDAENERMALARHRIELVRSRKYIKSSGRTHEEIDAEIRELRNDERF
ncbi:MAG: hypothetical protein IJG64_04530 [Oscillospiraceae bacterium]|nr:hypothetical protein [Oscillospiraceae bacterium]